MRLKIGTLYEQQFPGLYVYEAGSPGYVRLTDVGGMDNEAVRGIVDGLELPIWQPIETCPQDTFCIVYQGGTTRTMLREGGVWLSTAVAVDKFGDYAQGITVRETGVYEPTHWMPLPRDPAA